MKYFFEQIVRARKALGLTQSDVARKLGMRQGHLSRIEQGKVDIRLSNFLDIARLLGLEVMLVPRQVKPVIEQLLRGDEPSETRTLPQRLLDEEEHS